VCCVSSAFPLFVLRYLLQEFVSCALCVFLHMVVLLLVCVNLLSFDSVVSSLFFDPRFLPFEQLTNIFFLACLSLTA